VRKRTEADALADEQARHGVWLHTRCSPCRLHLHSAQQLPSE
jgi:hypothetical protein